MVLLDKIYTSPVELLRKTEKEETKLLNALQQWDEENIKDYLFNFVVSCYHLIDWVKASYPELKDDVYALLNNNQYIRACRDLCNASKHVKLETDKGAYRDHPAVVTDVETSATGESTLSELPSYRLKVQFENGDRLPAEEVFEKAVNAWNVFFETHNIK